MKNEKNILLPPGTLLWRYPMWPELSSVILSSAPPLGDVISHSSLFDLATSGETKTAWDGEVIWRHERLQIIKQILLVGLVYFSRWGWRYHMCPLTSIYGTLAVHAMMNWSVPVPVLWMSTLPAFSRQVLSATLTGVHWQCHEKCMFSLPSQNQISGFQKKIWDCHWRYTLKKTIKNGGQRVVP